MTFEAGDLVAAFSAAGVEFYTGVADSLLAPFNAEIERREGELTHIPAPNEGSAVAVAAGYHAASGRVPVVYLQNSGLGNAWNPLVSLTDPGVYGIPMVLVIGWRGEPGRPDEPQHLLQGEVMLDQLRLLRIPIFEIPSGGESLADLVETAVQAAIDRPGPTAIVVRKGDLSGSVDRGDGTVKYSLRRADVIATLLEELPADTVFVATTGYAGRELAQLRDERHEVGVRDLLVVGSMGHASSIAFGIAVASPDTPVCCIDGDGAVAMHTGVLPLIGAERPTNLVHVVINNGVHESVGGQRTSVRNADLVGLARASGYPAAMRCNDADELRRALRTVAERPLFLDVAVATGTLDNLGRPSDLGKRFRRLRESLADD